MRDKMDDMTISFNLENYALFIRATKRAVTWLLALLLLLLLIIIIIIIILVIYSAPVTKLKLEHRCVTNVSLIKIIQLTKM